MSSKPSKISEQHQWPPQKNSILMIQMFYVKALTNLLQHLTARLSTFAQRYCMLIQHCTSEESEIFKC